MILRVRVTFFVTILLALTLSAPLCEGAGKRQAYKQPVHEVEGTVLSLRRYEMGTYLEVLRDDGRQEWVEINREEGLDVRPDQRVAYTPEIQGYETERFGWLRTGHDFRILPPTPPEERIYQGSERDGTITFTDNPSESMPRKDFSSAEALQKSREKSKKTDSRMQEQDEIIVVDQEELLREKELSEEYYRYAEQTNAVKPARKAKRAKPKPYN